MGRYALTLLLLAAALSLALFLPVFRYSWAFDDFEYINVSAAVLAGKLPLATALALPHDEHVLPAFRLLLLGFLKLFGLNVVLWRVLMALVLAASAVFTALLARRYGDSPRAGVAAAIAFIAPCGFSSMWMWYPSGAVVPLAFAAITGASALLAWRDHLRLRRILAAICVAFALLTWAAYAPMALLPAIVDELERRRARARGPIGVFSLFCVAMMVAVLLAMRAANADRAISVTRGLPRAVFIAAIAPFRFFFPAVSIPSENPGKSTAIVGSILGLVIGAIVLVLLGMLWRRKLPPLALLAALSTIPALGVFVLVGLGRWNISYAEIYYADRYHFPLLISIALLVGAIAATIRVRASVAVVLAVVIVAEVAQHRQAMVQRIPTEDYTMQGRRFAALDRLVRRLEAASPIAIPDDLLWFGDLHSHLDAAVITHVFSNGQRIRLGGPIDEPRLNAVLDAWARELGEPVPYVRVVGGRFVNTRFASRIDFAVAPFDALVVRGFGRWEPPLRWMTARAELLLMMAPADLELRLGAPEPARVRVTLFDDAYGGSTTALGVIDVAPGIRDYRLPTAPIGRRVGLGRLVRIILESDRPVQVFSVGTESPRATPVV